jgi:hypothetical protein
VKAHILCACFPLQVTDSLLFSHLHRRLLQMLPSFSTVLRSPASLTPRFLTRLQPPPRAVSSSSSVAPPGMEPSYKFGPYKIDAGEVFHATPLSYAMVNLRPLLPGKFRSFVEPSGLEPTTSLGAARAVVTNRSGGEKIEACPRKCGFCKARVIRF